MAHLARVDAADGKEFQIGIPTEDPDAPPGQYNHPPSAEPQFVLPEDLIDLTDAIGEDGKLKVGWYDLDEGKYIGTTRPDPLDVLLAKPEEPPVP